MRIDYTTVIRDWPARCPCGATAAHRYGLCRKCQARATWKRRKAPARQRTTSAARRISRRAGRLLGPVLPTTHTAPTVPADNQPTR
jgi:hypothetical protein